MEKMISDGLAGSVCGFRLPRYGELPDMGLYLEQAVKYINQQVGALELGELTGSMVRNYVKQGLIPNPVGKRYSANQIAHLIVIALLKQVIPLEHIGDFFQFQRRVYTDQVAYDYFCEELENILYFRFGLKPECASVGTTDTVEKEMLQSAIVALSHIVYLNACLSLTARKNAGR